MGSILGAVTVLFGIYWSLSCISDTTHPDPSLRRQTSTTGNDAPTNEAAPDAKDPS